jgi:hypothetical protein
MANDIHNLALAQAEDARLLNAVTNDIYQLAVVEADHGRRLAILRDNFTAIAAVEDKHTKALGDVKNQLGEWRVALNSIVDLISVRSTGRCDVSPRAASREAQKRRNFQSRPDASGSRVAAA